MNAGITVGLVALRLAMAFSIIASGLTPQAGIYSASVPDFLISAFGGSKSQNGGPTGAFVVVIAGIVAAHSVDGLFMCTVMAGALRLVLGITGMGAAVKFILRPVVIGSTNVIAVPIASTQMKDFFCKAGATRRFLNIVTVFAGSACYIFFYERKRFRRTGEVTSFFGNELFAYRKQL